MTTCFWTNRSVRVVGRLRFFKVLIISDLKNSPDWTLVKEENPYIYLKTFHGLATKTLRVKSPRRQTVTNVDSYRQH